MDMKTCTKCGIEKSIESFQKASRNKDGYQSQCKECTSIAVKARRIKRNELNSWPKKTEPCPRCGGSVFQKSGKCSSCASATFAKWLGNNREKRNKQQLVYRSENSEKTSAATKKWRENNPNKVAKALAAYRERNRERIALVAKEYKKKKSDQVKKKQKEWRDANKDKIREKSAAYKQKNKERIKALKDSWRSRNKNVEKIHNQNRRSRIKANGGKLSRDIVDRLLALQKGRCACCGLVLGDKYHLDHIMPLSLGGSNTDSNVQILRAECNLKKRAKHPIDYMQSIGLLL